MSFYFSFKQKKIKRKETTINGMQINVIKCCGHFIASDAESTSCYFRKINNIFGTFGDTKKTVHITHEHIKGTN